MDKFEYKIIKESVLTGQGNGQIDRALNYLGDEGWELILIRFGKESGYEYYFKRKKINTNKV